MKEEAELETPNRAFRGREGWNEGVWWYERVRYEGVSNKKGGMLIASIERVCHLTAC